MQALDRAVRNNPTVKNVFQLYKAQKAAGKIRTF